MIKESCFYFFIKIGPNFLFPVSNLNNKTLEALLI